MKILVTGAKGFIGKNLISELRNRKYDTIFEFDKDTDISLLDSYTKECNFVFHLAGINRPQDDKEFMEGNYGFTTTLLRKLIQNKNNSTILITSSIQADLNNKYGISKKAAEDEGFLFGKDMGNKVLVYRLPNVFGKWCKPNYNSVVATFCNNIATDEDIIINDPTVVMNLVYIDDVIHEFINAIEGRENKTGKFCSIPIMYTVTLGEVAEMIYSFKESRINLSIPNMSNDFENKLYSTYLSYLPKEKFSYPLRMNMDERGSFTEFIRTPDRGQVSINITKPGITKGNHWHHSKNEKFLVVNGEGLIRFRRIGETEVIEYKVNGNKLEVIDIPVGYTHSIINIGENDLVTIMWVNECFNSERPDTYYLEV